VLWQCKICGREYKGALGCGIHVSRIHHLSSQQYFDGYLGQPKQCYCGKQAGFESIAKGYREHCSPYCGQHSKIRGAKISKSKMGHGFSVETRKKLSKAREGKSSGMKGRHPVAWNKGKRFGPASFELREKNRMGQIRYIEKMHLMGHPLVPRISLLEHAILNELEAISNQPIIRQHRVSGYFLDGYIPSVNLAIEVNETVSHSGEKAKLHDIKKQKDIVQKLGCHYFEISESTWLNDRKSIVDKFVNLALLKIQTEVKYG
jgi:hypothetical protein